MNNLEVLGQVKTISSREVAEMMDVRHGDLLEKIDKINKDFGSGKIRCQKYWIESTFENRGKQYREYQVTKLGCEFLAHKTTGKKGNLFTVRYMDKFEEMKQELQQVDSYMIADPIERAKAWIREEEERKMLALTVEQQKPKVEYHDTVLNSNKLVTTTDIAKDLGMSARSLNLKLNELGIIFKQGKSWKLYAKHQNKVPEYCDYHINEFGQTLKWTEKGRKFIIDTLNEM
jgi:phage regulator Rha-like protein